jgi:hypothetical protein
MPQSTPITELQGNTETVNNTSQQPTSTKPLVQDILKEIQQENGAAPASLPQEVTAAQPPAQAPESTLEVPPTMTETGAQEYNAQQEQALQYQMDPNVQPQTDTHQVDPAQVDPSAMMQPGMMQGGDIGLDYPQKPVSTAQKALEHLKDPLLVVLLSILLSVPAVSGFILQQVSRIPGGNSQMVPILVRAVLAGALFYVLRRFV